MTTNTQPSSSPDDISPPLFRYGLLAVGLLLALFAALIMEHKRTMARAAAGDVAAIAYEISKLEKEKVDAKESRKKEIDSEITKLKEDDLEPAQEEAADEQIDKDDGIWMYSMIRFFGVACMALGFLVLAGVGSGYEKIGALIGLAYMVTMLAK